MEHYGPVFARVYDRHWSRFAREAAPAIRTFYERASPEPTNKTLLDLCCGTGQLAAHFLEHGYQVTGLDLSEPMLAVARQNTRAFAQSGQATFVQADVTDFSLDERFGLVVATYDALNHLRDLAALRRCFACVFPHLLPGGSFIFDLNTRYGLSRFNGITVEDHEEYMLVTRGLFDAAGGRAWTRISGFVRVDDGHYERFEETAFNTAFDLADVRDALIAAGWPDPYYARLETLAVPLQAPEEDGRVFVVANR